MPWGQIAGLMLVAVDPAAKNESLDMELTWTSCGMTYTDRTKCPRTEVQIGKAGGYVTDTLGASLADANIFLIDMQGLVVQQTRSDKSGDFTLPDAPPGRYEFVVQSTGFTRARSRVRVAGEDGIPAPSSLHVQLEIGRCSVARND
jgi:hypothetical protein